MGFLRVRIAYSYIAHWDPAEHVPSADALHAAVQKLDEVQGALIRGTDVDCAQMDETLDAIGTPDTLDLRAVKREPLATFR